MCKGVITIAAPALCGASCSEKKQFQQQADVFYYSGHGEHDTGRFYGVAGPGDVTNHWRNIDTVVFAGCAILDVDDLAQRVDPTCADPAASPGRKWIAASGASTLLGYCWKAPLDDQGGVQIVADWCATRTSLGDVGAWMKANDNPAGHNACALNRIDQNSFEYHFFSRTEHSVFGQHIFNSYKLTSEIIEVTK